MRIRRPSPAVAASVLLVALLVPATPAAAGIPGSALSVNAVINDCEVVGNLSVENGEKIVVKHRSPSGALRAKHTLTIVDGLWQIPCPGPKLRGGDTLAFSRKADGAAIRTFTVPKLTIRTDRVGNRAFGKAPGVSTVDVELIGCDAAHYGCTGENVQDVPVAPGTHAWSIASMNDLRGGAEVVLTWQKGSDSVARKQRFAQVIVRPGSATVSGFGPSTGSGQSVTTHRGTAVASGSPTTRSDAAFSTTVKRNGAKRSVKAGDVVRSSVASDAKFTVPATSLNVNVASVDGTCAPNSAVTILQRSLEGAVQFGFLETADPTGFWEVTGAVPPDTIVEAWCATDAGDATVRSVTIN